MNFSLNRLQTPNIIYPKIQPIIRNTVPATNQTNQNIYVIQTNMIGRLMNGKPCGSCGK